ncbi:hypothetical protein [Pseudonocardia sp.]|uniref:hypothetical protein n=1 Tax=Pseudonocardia sp. TaxID=60912 RepID=UPI002F3E9CFF
MIEPELLPRGQQPPARFFLQHLLRGSRPIPGAERACRIRNVAPQRPPAVAGVAAALLEPVGGVLKRALAQQSGHAVGMSIGRRLRGRYGWMDHLVRAGQRYLAYRGYQQAAALT